MFCSTVQSASWWRRFRVGAEKVEYGVEKIEVFEVE